MPEEKVVYDPKEHTKAENNAGKNVTEKEIVYPQPAKATKTKKKKENDVVDAKAHAEDGADVEPDEFVTEFKTKINKYGFLHVPKKAQSSLPFKIEDPLKAKIDGNALVIRGSS